jgi:Zn-dependent protease with chaperone function
MQTILTRVAATLTRQIAWLTLDPDETPVRLARIVQWFSLDSSAMYLLALISELPVLLMRTVVVWTAAFLILLASGHSTHAADGWSELAILPTILSAIALLNPAGTGWWWRARTGGRRPSERERLAYQDAIDLLQAHTTRPLPLPKDWFVLDLPTPEAAVCGHTLMLSRGMLDNEHLPAVLAHELGHLATPDGRLTAAINRLVIRPPLLRADGHYEGTRIDFYDPRIMLPLFGIRTIAWAAKKALAFANGGFGLRLTRPIWGVYWRAREYTADQYAASLGLAEDLAEFLETHALMHDHPVPYIWLTEHTHPPVELRIERLRNTTEHAPTPPTPPITITPTDTGTLTA